MLYCYDNAIADDLRKSFDPLNMGDSLVKVVDAEGVLQLIAQMQEDKISLPIVVLTRHEDTPIDQSRMNFTRLHKGVPVVMDIESNNLYHEKVLPIELKYDITVLAANTADRDELIRELLFKYTSMFFIAFQLPYESDRKVRFGVEIDPDTDISNKSGSFDYIEGGTLYQSIMTLRCQGAVLLSYTPVKLKRSQYEIEPTLVKLGQEP